MLCVLVSGGDFCLSFAFDVEGVLIGHYVASNPRYSSSTPQALWLVDDSKKINIFDHIAPTPVLYVVDDWPRSTTRAEWFRLTHDLIQSVIADMDLDPDLLSQVEEAFIPAGLL